MVRTQWTTDNGTVIQESTGILVDESGNSFVDESGNNLLDNVSTAGNGPRTAWAEAD
jgi:hypothetical protein